ncbi:MAG: aspartate kinase [Planctomycetes bacterium]|nr:aspartate kinase [Planctomycetota bacterium]
MIVMKFGGTSLRNAERIKAVAGIIKSRLKQSPVVIVSAHHGVTEQLIAAARTPSPLHYARIRNLHRRITKELGLPLFVVEPLLKELEDFLETIRPDIHRSVTLKEMDEILSFGERFSCRVMAGYLNKINIPATSLDAYDIGMLTDSHFGNARPLPQSHKDITARLRPTIHSGRIPVVTGFIGKDREGNITTLGRNGSDYTATIIGAAVGASEIQLWSDVHGIMSADPRLVHNAKPVPAVSFNEAGELAYYSRRFHPSTLTPAIHKNIPVRILNTYEPTAPGTTISAARPKKTTVPDKAVKTIVYKKDLFLVTITSGRMLMQYGFLAKIFSVFAKYKIVIDMVATSEISVSCTTDRKDHIREALKEIARFAGVQLDEKKAVVCVIGENIKYLNGLSADIFMALKRAGVKIHMISYGATGINIAFLVDNRDVRKSVRSLHRLIY